jgi:hypothetical protein
MTKISLYVKETFVNGSLAQCFETILGSPVRTVEFPGIGQPMLVVSFPGGGI